MTERSDHDLLIELNVKMDLLSTQFAVHVVDDVKVRGGYELRLTSLEQWRWKWAGGVMVAVFVWNVASYLFVRLLPY